MAMIATDTFLWGVGGSLAVEIVALAHHYQTHPSRLPTRYSKWGFYVVRALLAAVAGGVAVAYQIDRPLLALNIGAATPLIIQAFARMPPEPPALPPATSG